MGRRALLSSAIVFVLLAAATWWILGREEAAPAAPFFTLARRLPDTLTVIAGGDTTVVVPGGEGGWRVIRPVEYPADAVVLDAMVKRLADLTVDRRFPLEPEKLDTYGMRIPRGLVRAAYRDGSPPDTLVIGSFTFDDAFDYVRSGSRAEVGLLTTRTSRTYLLKRTVEIRENRLLPFPETQAAGFQLLSEGGKVRVEAARDSAGAWRILRPYPGPGFPKKIGEYLESLSHMHIRSFVREEEGSLGPFGLDRPRAGVRVVLEDGRVFGASLGDPIPGTDLQYAITLARPQVLGVSIKYLPVLEWDGDRFRRPGIVSFGMAQVGSVEIAGPGGPVVHRVRGQAPAAPEAIIDALGNWVLFQASRFAEATPGLLRETGLAGTRRSLLWLGVAESEGGVADTLARIDLGRSHGGETPLRVLLGRDPRPGEVLFVAEDVAEPLYRFLSQREPSP